MKETKNVNTDDILQNDKFKFAGITEVGLDVSKGILQLKTEKNEKKLKNII